MVIKNKTRGTVLSESAVQAESFMQKALGLILSEKPKTMLFQTRFGIHTFFMKYPIDVLILNSQNQVSCIKKSLKQNRIFIWNPKYKVVIELPAGTIEKTNTNLRDELNVIARSEATKQSS